MNEINQVILNIAVNAAHAIGDMMKGSNDRGLIKGRTMQQGDHVVSSISDSGGGIPENIGARIYDPFFTQSRPASCARLTASHTAPTAAHTLSPISR